MINVFTLTNINTRISEGKLNKILLSEVCIKLVSLRMNLYQAVAHSFKKVGDQCLYYKAGVPKLG